jgi:hypothetical protein
MQKVWVLLIYFLHAVVALCHKLKPTTPLAALQLPSAWHITEELYTNNLGVFLGRPTSSLLSTSPRSVLFGFKIREGSRRGEFTREVA